MESQAEDAEKTALNAESEPCAEDVELIEPVVPDQPPSVPAPPPGVPNVPPGLEYLTHIDQLLIHQQVEVLEVVSGIETCNKYLIKNSVGQQVFCAIEESGWCMRCCCRSRRGFVMHISDNFAQEVIRLVRDLKCCACCGCCACIGCCSMTVRVESPVGVTVGYVRQRRSLFGAKYSVEDAGSKKQFTVSGPCCHCQGLCCGLCCRGDIKFRIKSVDGQVVGKIGKQWSGYVKEKTTSADNFSITFAADTDVRMKATLLGAVFLLDYMYFEEHKTAHKKESRKDN